MPKKMDISVYQLPKNGNNDCGDSYFYEETEEGFICALADGLGSGKYAKESSQLVIDIIRENRDIPIEELGKKLNSALVGKRGAVVGILKIDFAQNRFTYFSIGNIGFITALEGNKKKRSIPNSGYLASHKQVFKVYEDELQQNMNFIIFSDGVKEKELTNSYYLHQEVETITKMYKQRMNGNADDDTTLIVIRYNGD